MKDYWDWTEEDLNALISDEIKESLTLDYKRSAALAKQNPKRQSDLSKDVAAFANSAGGVLVYGMVETDDYKPTGLDDGLDPREVTREWIEQIIHRIQPRIEGVRINQVELHAKSPGRVAYVVYVPQSVRAPHMAEDHIYYKRYNFMSVPMEDYEVRDIANRSTSPLLNVQLTIRGGQMRPPLNGIEPSANGELYIFATMLNESPTPAMYSVVHVFFDPRLSVQTGSTVFQHAGTRNFNLSEDHSQEMAAMRLNIAIPKHLPIWRGMPVELGQFLVEVPERMQHRIYNLGWTVDAIGMPTQKGLAQFMTRNGNAWILPPDQV